MLPIKSEKINKELSKKWQYDFEIEENGIYLIEITARVKSWWQNLKSFKSFFNDDDLVVAIDNVSFPKLNNKKGLFDSEMSWNGNGLKGLSKTNLFVLYFEKGKHTLNFINDKNPFLENINIFQIENEFKYVPTQNNTAEFGDRRPWFSVAFVGFSINNLKINISAGKNDKDDEDSKLIIDGNIQENNTEKSHKNWFWCGKILQGKEEEFNEELKLEKGIHYIELYADGSPVLNKIEAEISRKKIGEIPTVDNPKWTGDFSDDTEQMILARAIWGEARGTSELARTAVAWSIKNRLGTLGTINKKVFLRDTYHKIILEPSQYSAFWEMPGKDPNLMALKDPLGTTKNPIDHDKWGKTYDIAGQVISGKISDPIYGANHYIDDSRSDRPPSWATEKNFKKKIGNISFYKL